MMQRTPQSEQDASLTMLDRRRALPLL